MEQMLSRTSDVIVVGAGIIGASIAWRLRQQGHSVMLIDAGEMGSEASSAGAGMLAPGGEVEDDNELTRLSLESLALYPSYVEELRESTGVRIDFQQNGAVELAVDETAWAALEARARKQQAIGIPNRPVHKDEVRELVPLLRRSIEHAIHYPQDAAVDPRTVMAALRAVCTSLGCSVRERMQVTSIDPNGAVTAAGQTFSAGHVVLAAGAWSTTIGGVPDVPKAYPVRGHLICFEMFAGSLKPIVRENHTYMVQRSDGKTICGSSTEHVGFDRQIDGLHISDIALRARKLIPSLDALPVTGQWNGFRPATDAGAPVVGRYQDTSLWLAYGHYRNGILLAPETARRISCGIGSAR